MKKLLILSLLAAASAASLAKLPPLSDEAKAKAAEAAAKAAWAGKVDAFKLCQSQDKVVAHYKKAPAAKEVKPATKAPAAASACVDPGPFVYTPAVASPAVAAPAAAPAASAAVPAKKS